ncbi:MAG: thermonuclease family protein [Planctomycetota bacterium]|nr:thermonuclease family protein [Planctomycetota bacterium]
MEQVHVEVIGPLTIRSPDGRTYQYAGLSLPSWLLLDFKRLEMLTELHRNLIGNRTVRIKPINIRNQNKNYTHPPAIVFLDTQILNLALVNHGIACVRKDGYYALKSFSKSLVDAQTEAAESSRGIWSGQYGQFPYVKSRKSEFLHNPYCKIRYKISQQNYTEIDPAIDLNQSQLIPCNICMPVRVNPRPTPDVYSVAKFFVLCLLVISAVLIWTYFQSKQRPTQTITYKLRRQRNASPYLMEVAQYLTLLNERFTKYFALRGITFAGDLFATSFPPLERDTINILHAVLVSLSARDYSGARISLTIQNIETEAIISVLLSNLPQPPPSFDNLQKRCLSLNLSPAIGLSFVSNN